MLKVAFLHDVEMDYIGGAELSNKKIIDAAKSLGYTIFYDDLTNFEKTKTWLSDCDVAIVNNIVKCDYEFELITHLIAHDIPYVKWEHDYGLCAKRSIYCYVDSKVKNCCDTNRFHQYRNLFVNSKLNVFQSPMHFEYHQRLYGEAVTNHIVLPPPIQVEALSVSEEKKKDEVLFLGDIKFIKGGHELLEYAETHPEKHITVYGKNRLRRKIPNNISFKEKTTNTEILKALGETEYFFFKPRWPEPSGRVAAEAFLSGAKIISNERVGTFSYDFYPNAIEKGRQLMQNAPIYFWEQVNLALRKTVTTPKFKHALIYKSYGGLGDQFIAIPAINKLQAVSEQVTVALPDNLIKVFKAHTKDLNFMSIKDIETTDLSAYDKVINLGNYPKSRRFRNVGVINYETHHKLRQHALKHYIDAIATMHPEADNSYSGFPYFKSNTNTEQPYFTVHPGAGFKPKWWPTERYVELIEVLLKKFPTYRCTVIIGPNDPEPKHFAAIDRVTIETGNLDEVAVCLSGATFHIGNDSGITHFAGVYNVPSVSFHGLTGPGSWATLAENREVVWGKPGHCNIKCKYDIAIACEHRICLHSITVNKAVAAVYKLLQNSMEADQNTKIKFIFNPEVVIKNTNRGFLLNTKEKELLLEFKAPAEQLEFEQLVQNDLFESDIKEANLKPLITALVNEGLVFAIPFKA
ncbi:glycosyltransferase family 9 protein [Psychroserpens sp. SPM9]|uniref:glycosyltransferase family 9 protein n=1 Tax=Psychroserpens sp. SPM9 TaxID=2975598 RepID=UPI0021A56DDB|nr:glycosyltransferase family 9 protein [Psychroserpens sp. SPM9]MDG5489934.1 glycosyltransferase family 9 protein [Psychroserpens sp. SPM9]